MTWTARDWSWGGTPWDFLGQPLALDVAATVKRRGDAHVELWRDGSDVAQWCALMDGRAPRLTPEQAGTRLGELRAVRDDVFAVLGAVVDGTAYPDAPAQRLDARARSHPVIAQLGGGPVVAGTTDPVDELLARTAASAIEIARDPGELTFCDAPSCGQFYLRERRGQVWCSTACGTRARVARHARRTRTPPPT
jgi:predicted RNA-binding Zn ribbon-like protein